MDIPINAKVICTNGPCGRSTYIVLDPIKEDITHFVVEESNLPNIERLVPIENIAKSSHDEIHLTCTREELSKMDPFVETDFLRSDEIEYSVPFEYPYSVPFLVWPYIGLPDDVRIIELEHVPPSELAVRRGASVNASDGFVGEVDEFVVDPKNGHITHLIMRRGPRWGKKDVTIPVSKIDHISENSVHLKMDMLSITLLPSIPLKRRWQRKLNR
jgi:hypothetical protein